MGIGLRLGSPQGGLVGVVGRCARAVGGAAELDAGNIRHFECHDLVGHFDLDLARRTAQIGAVDNSAVLESDDVGESGGRKGQTHHQI